MCYSSNLPIFKLDIFLHKAFGILRRYTACFPPLQAAAMNDWSESTYRGYPRTYLCLSFLSFFLSLISFFLCLFLLRASDWERGIEEERAESAAFHPLSIVVLVGDEDMPGTRESGPPSGSLRRVGRRTVLPLSYPCTNNSRC